MAQSVQKAQALSAVFLVEGPLASPISLGLKLLEIANIFCV